MFSKPNIFYSKFNNDNVINQQDLSGFPLHYICIRICMFINGSIPTAIFIKTKPQPRQGENCDNYDVVNSKVIHGGQL